MVVRSIMAKKNDWHSSHTGSKFHEWVVSAFTALGIECIEEKIAHSRATAKREKGKFDLRVEMEPVWCIELKSIGQPYFGIFNSPCVKGHQLRALREAKTRGMRAGVMIEFRNSAQIVYIDITDYDRLIYDNLPRKTFKVDTALNYGLEVNSVKQLIKELE